MYAMEEGVCPTVSAIT